MAYRSAFDREDGTSPRENADSAAPRPLLPPVIANTLTDGARMIAGAACLAGVAVLGASLASWSPADPSLTHATAAAPHNLLGRPGAALADLMIETFGLSSLAVVLPPLFWGLTLVARDNVRRPIRRLLAAIAGVAAAAAACASVPVPQVWPAHHGLGGFAGEALARIAGAPLAGLQPLVARGLEGAAFAGFAIVLVGFATGAFGRERTRRTTTRRWTSSSSATKTAHSQPSRAASYRQEPEFTSNPQRPATQPQTRRDDTRAATPADPRQYGPYAQFDPEAVEIEDEASEFDDWTQAASRTMAARFAPAQVNGPQTLLQTVSKAFNAPVAQADPEQRASMRAAAGRPTGGQAASDATYKRPSLNLLERPRTQRASSSFGASLMRGNARLLEDVMAEFGVVGVVRAITPGPVITVYEFEPARGTRIERVVALADDIARGMSVPSARIATLVGQATLAVELPNDSREAVSLRDVLDTDSFRNSPDILPLAIGRAPCGSPVVSDLTRLPHLLVAGAAGSGRSAGVQAMILSLIYKHGPDNCRFLMIDQKMVELSRFEGIPHLLTPIVTDPHKAVTALAWCVREMEERMKRMAAAGVRSIDLFNNRVRNAKKRGERIARTVQTGFDERTGAARFEDQEMNPELMPYIVIVIEELADLMAVAGPEIEGAVKRLAEAARQAGIHLIIASERPGADVVTPGIKGAIAARISYRVHGRSDSRAVLGCEGAEQLLGGGDMLYTTGVGEPARVHGVSVSDGEVNGVADHLRSLGAPRYVEALTAAGRTARYPAPPAGGTETAAGSRRVTVASEDALFDRAVAIVVRERRASVGLIERRLNVSKHWATVLLGRLQDARVIGPPDHTGHHPLLSESVA